MKIDRDLIVIFDLGDEDAETTLGDIQDALEEHGYTIAKLYDPKNKN